MLIYRNDTTTISLSQVIAKLTKDNGLGALIRETEVGSDKSQLVSTLVCAPLTLLVSGTYYVDHIIGGLKRN